MNLVRSAARAAGVLAMCGAITAAAPRRPAHPAVTGTGPRASRPAAAAPADPRAADSLAAPDASPGAIRIDSFDDLSTWKAVPADGVSLDLVPDAGADGRGRSMRLDFDFHGGGGYAVAHRAVSLDLPANYRISFRVRGKCPVNNLEFKLIDGSGDNVWWLNSRDVEFPESWTLRTIRRRQVSFAWGPQGGGEPGHIAAIEFAVTAGEGGRGSVWIDDLELQPLPPPDSTAHAIVARASSEVAARPAAFAVDSSRVTYWACDPGDATPWLALDLGAQREIGGLILDWLPDQHGVDYTIELSSDRVRWTVAKAIRGGNGGRDALDLPGSEARYVRLRVSRRYQSAGVALADLRIMPLAWSATPNDFFSALAREAPRGRYPRAFTGELAYWTVVGQDFDTAEALLDEDGRLETGRGAFSIEPFLWNGERLLTWADAERQVSLADGALPVPSVEWRAADLRLTVTAFGSGEPGRSTVLARYRLRNEGRRTARVTLDLALRPFQVNPPSQFLGRPGGVAPIRDLARDDRVIHANGTHGIVSLTPPSGFGASTFDQGDVLDFLAEGRLPMATSVVDSSGRASGALTYARVLAPGEEAEIDVLVPLHDPPAAPAFAADAAVASRFAAGAQAVTEAQWRARLDRVTLQLPDSAMDVVRALKSQLGWVLVNRAGPAIQPGTRSYARSWIRDGCLTASALLRFGETQAVRQFIDWYAPHQYANGKAPCCVDSRGSDPVPEHDSSGEFIFLIAEYVRATGDRGFAEAMWPRVRGAVAYLDSLRHTRRGGEWDTPANAPFRGLLPPSISHEGYSAKPMHSYWDDLFALRGFKDAAWLAGWLGRPERGTYEALRWEFTRDLVASYRATMAAHRIDYLAGCADLGDFDATSTSIALDPVNAEDVLPDSALRATFDRYWTFFQRRERGEEKWEAFTPYEWRNVGALVRLGERERAQEALRWFLGFRRPLAWNHWAEVVWRDPRATRFIGDMPHTWVGTDYARAVLDMIAYERERDSTLVLAAGVPLGWLADSGVVVRGLRTRWGPLAYTLRREGRGRDSRVVLRLEDSGMRVPPGGLEAAVPLPAGWPARPVETRSPAGVTLAPSVVVHALPAEIVWSADARGRPRR